MWEALKKSIDLEPPVPLQDNVYLGCKQEPEAPDAEAVQQKALIFNGFFMNKHAQDMADAERRAPKGDAPASKSSTIAPRKGMQSHSDEKDSIQNPKTLLKEEKCLPRNGRSDNHKDPKTSIYVTACKGSEDPHGNRTWSC